MAIERRRVILEIDTGNIVRRFDGSKSNEWIDFHYHFDALNSQNPGKYAQVEYNVSPDGTPLTDEEFYNYIPDKGLHRDLVDKYFSQSSS